MSNIIKSENVNYVAPTKLGLIALQIPMIDTGHTPEQKIEKMKEELDELLNEFCIGKVSTADALSEMFDVIQVMLGYLIADAKEVLAPHDAYAFAANFIRNANEQHLEKMRNYAADRGWKVIGG